MRPKQRFRQRIRPIFIHSIITCSYCYFHIAVFQFKDLYKDQPLEKLRDLDQSADKGINMGQDRHLESGQDRVLASNHIV